MEPRRFVVIGLGRFGHHLARFLFELGHDVLALDRKPDTVEAIVPHCSRAHAVDAGDRDALEAAGAGLADVGVISLGESIDVSVLATLFLKELGVREIVAKAVSWDHGRILQRVGATEVVHPERDVAVQLAQRLAEPDIVDRIPFLEGYALVEILAPPALWGRTLAESQLRREHGLSVVLVRRTEPDGERSLPARPDQPVRQGDVLVVVARPEDVERFRRTHPGAEPRRS